MDKKTIQFMKKHGYIYFKKGKTHTFEKPNISTIDRKLYDVIKEYGNRNDESEFYLI